jgi:hypothetical protein
MAATEAYGFECVMSVDQSDRDAEQVILSPTSDKSRLNHNHRVIVRKDFQASFKFLRQLLRPSLPDTFRECRTMRLPLIDRLTSAFRAFLDPNRSPTPSEIYGPPNDPQPFRDEIRTDQYIPPNFVGPLDLENDVRESDVPESRL